jgi:hypothetical protein
MNNSNNSKQEERKYQRQRHLLKCIEGFEERLKSISVGRWRDRVSDMNTKEDGSYTITRRLRLRFLKRTMELFREGLAFQK